VLEAYEAYWRKTPSVKRLVFRSVPDESTRLAMLKRGEAFVLSTGARAYDGFPDIDGLYQEQASELDPKRRAAILHKIQQLMHERVVFAPLLEPALLNGYGPRVADSGLGLIVGHLYSAPYEDLKLKGK